MRIYITLAKGVSLFIPSRFKLLNYIWNNIITDLACGTCSDKLNSNVCLCNVFRKSYLRQFQEPQMFHKLTISLNRPTKLTVFDKSQFSFVTPLYSYASSLLADSRHSALLYINPLQWYVYILPQGKYAYLLSLIDGKSVLLGGLSLLF